MERLEPGDKIPVVDTHDDLAVADVDGIRTKEQEVCLTIRKPDRGYGAWYAFGIIKAKIDRAHQRIEELLRLHPSIQPGKEISIIPKDQELETFRIETVDPFLGFVALSDARRKKHLSMNIDELLRKQEDAATRMFHSGQE